MKDAEYAIHILGGEIEEQIAFYLPDSEFYRNLFVVKSVMRLLSNIQEKWELLLRSL